MTLYVNEVEVKNAKLYVEDETTYLPLRAILEQLGSSKLHFDNSDYTVSYTLHGRPYTIYLIYDEIFTPEDDYKYFRTIVIDNRVYVNPDYIEYGLLLDVEIDVQNNKAYVNSLDYAYSDELRSLANSYYTFDIPAEQLFSYNVNTYYDMYYHDLERQLHLESPDKQEDIDLSNITIGAVNFHSINEADIITSVFSQNQFVSKFIETKLYFNRLYSIWRIDLANYLNHQVTLLVDVDEKAAALLQSSPDKVDKVLRDLQANYDAINGTDVQAAINAYSPIFINDWNRRSRYTTWEGIVSSYVTNL